VLSGATADLAQIGNDSGWSCRPSLKRARGGLARDTDAGPGRVVTLFPSRCGGGS
jgi:hypothetical protein